MKAMKKWMMVVCMTTMLAMNVEAGMIEWGFFNEGSFIYGEGTLYLFALGSSEHEFGDGSFDAVTGTLTSKTDGTVFSTAGVGFVGQEWPTFQGGIEGLGDSGFIGAFTDPLSFNQWWCVVAVGGDTAEWFGVDVFQISGLNEDGEYVRMWNANPAYWHSEHDGKPNSHGERFYEPFNLTQYSVAIPEPLTTGLALAGVALLMAQRRRK